MKIPEKLRKIKDLLELAARPEEMFDKVIVLIDHDTVSSNKEFIDKVYHKSEDQRIENIKKAPEL